MTTDFRAILDRHLDGDFALFAAGKDAPSLAVLEEFEKTLGYELPADFREFSTSRLGGIYIEVKKEIWPRPGVGDVGPFWSFLYGMMVYGFAADIPEWMDMRVQTLAFQRDTGTSHAPFLKIVGDADVYCFTARQSIVRWDHETGKFAAIEGGFTALLETEIGELRARKDRKTGVSDSRPPRASSTASGPLIESLAKTVDSLVGKSVNTPEMRAFLADLGVKESLGIDPDVGGTYVSRPALGFSLLFKDPARAGNPACQSMPKGVLVLVNCFFYSEGHEGYTRFAGKLPRGLSFADSRDATIQKLGPASWKRENKQGRLVAERWDDPSRSLHVTYTGDHGGIRILSFGLLFR